MTTAYVEIKKTVGANEKPRLSSLFRNIISLQQYSPLININFIILVQIQETFCASQQQFLVRDSSVGGWSNGVWNQVFSGVQGAPPQSFSTTPYDPPPYTTLDTSPVTREKPFLYADSSGKYFVFVLALRRDSVGTTWGSSSAAGTSVSICEFFIAKPSDSVSKINVALARGQRYRCCSRFDQSGNEHRQLPVGCISAGLYLKTYQA